MRARIGCGIAIALAVLLVSVSVASASLDITVELLPTGPLPDAHGKAVLEQKKSNTLLEVEAEGLAVGPAYFVCIGTTMDMTTHLHFPLAVEDDGKAELRVRLEGPPSAYSGGHVCVGYHEGDLHIHVLLGMIP